MWQDADVFVHGHAIRHPCGQLPTDRRRHGTPAIAGGTEKYHHKLFGLTIDPDRLTAIRHERKPNSRYSSFAQCEFEVREVESLFRRENIPHINSTHFGGGNLGEDSGREGCRAAFQVTSAPFVSRAYPFPQTCPAAVTNLDSPNEKPGIAAGLLFSAYAQDGITAACPLMAKSTSSRLATAYIA